LGFGTISQAYVLVIEKQKRRRRRYLIMDFILKNLGLKVEN